MDTLSIIREFDLPGEFPEDAMAEARAEAERFEAAVPPGRYDATAQTIVTIDPVDARDFDDAISLERLADGRWRLGVHIADVSHFVRPRTALDREAQHRATSVYLPDRVIPMLPEVISNALASLQPGKVRYTKTVYLEFTPEGLRTHVEFHDAAIRSAKRLTYEQVDAFLADPASWQRKLGAKVHGLLLRMHELAMILRRRRLKRGALELQMPEVKIDLDKQGRVAGAHVVRQHGEPPDHRGVHAGGQRGGGGDAPRPGPLVPPPHPQVAFAAEAQGADRVHRRPGAFDREASKAASRSRSCWPPSPAGPSSTRSTTPCCGRFSGPSTVRGKTGITPWPAIATAISPRPSAAIPDLTVHRLIEAILTGKRPRNDPGELVTLGEHCSEREQRAESAERELVKMKLLAYMADRIGEEMDGVITGVESFGLFVQGLEIPAEGLLHVDALQDDYYRYDRAAHTLSGNRSGNTFRLGDRVRVAVSRVDIDRRELDFRLVSHNAAPRRPNWPGVGESALRRAVKRRRGKKRGPARAGAWPSPSREGSVWSAATSRRFLEAGAVRGT